MRRSIGFLRSSPKAQYGWSRPQFGQASSRWGSPPQSQRDPHLKRMPGERETKYMERMVWNAFEPKSPDDKIFGGSGETKKNECWSQLRTNDRRFQAWLHPHLMSNVLKTIQYIHAPNGSQLSADYLTGRVVAFCAYSETDRCMEFLKALGKLQKKSQGDLVVVCLSVCMGENWAPVKRNGLHYLTWRNGAALVMRDLGVRVYGLPLPRLFVVDGASGWCFTNSGYTALKVNPHTCLDSWRKGQPGVSWTDFPLSWFLRFDDQEELDKL